MAVRQTCRSMVMILLSSTLVYSSKERIPVGRNTCGRSVNLDITEGVTLYVPGGQTSVLEECAFKFTSEDFKHDTCFKLTSKLNCQITIEYRTFDTLIDKTINCGDSDALQEYCDMYSEMSVVFIVNNEFFLYGDINVEVYRKFDEVIVGSVFSAVPIVSVCIAVVVFILLIFFFRAICVKYRHNGGSFHSPQPMPAQCVPLNSYPTQPSVPSSPYVFNTTPQSYSHGYQPPGHQPERYGQGNQPPQHGYQPSEQGGQHLQHGYQQPQQRLQPSAPGYQHPQQGFQPQINSQQGNQAEGFDQGYHPPLQNYPQGYQATRAPNSAAPPPSYDEAKYYPAPSKQPSDQAGGEDEQQVIKPGSEKNPDVPPPPYPGV